MGGFNRSRGPFRLLVSPLVLRERQLAAPSGPRRVCVFIQLEFSGTIMGRADIPGFREDFKDCSELRFANLL